MICSRRPLYLQQRIFDFKHLCRFSDNLADVFRIKACFSEFHYKIQVPIKDNLDNRTSSNF